MRFLPFSFIVIAPRRPAQTPPAGLAAPALGGAAAPGRLLAAGLPAQRAAQRGSRVRVRRRPEPRGYSSGSK